MEIRSAALVAALFLSGPGDRASAQDQASSPPSGTRVRLTLPCGLLAAAAPEIQPGTCSAAGALVRLDRDSITVTIAGAPTGFELNALSRLESSRGVRSHWQTGAAVGFLVGGATTFVVLRSGGSTSPCDRSANQDAMSATECLGLSALGGLAGAGLGAVVGGWFRAERWREVPLRHLRVGMGSLRRVELGARVAF